MAQLSDDCFAFGGPMMSVDEAVRIIAARVTAVHDVETVALTEADGRILAGDISAPLPLPPFTNSAVDGYAVRSGDLPPQGEQAFPVSGRIQAGASAQAPTSQPAQNPPAAEEASMHGYGDRDKTCQEWTDGCRTCQRSDRGEPVCPNIGIACQPKAITCARRAVQARNRRSGKRRQRARLRC